jgi:transcriptional regulator with XRE-family HTH domain
MAADEDETEIRAGKWVAELRRLSGLSWNELARLLNVGRRSLGFIASGKPVMPATEEHLKRILAVVRQIDRGSAAANRAALLEVADDGVIAFHLLADGEYDTAAAILGRDKGATRAASPTLTAEARLARAPRSPADLVGARNDRVHREAGTARAAKSVRHRSGRG